MFLHTGASLADIAMYRTNVGHPIQDPVNFGLFLPNHIRYDHFGSVVLAVELISEDNGKERSHLIVDLRICRFLCSVRNVRNSLVILSRITVAPDQEVLTF